VYLPYNYKLLNVFLNDRDERFNLIGPAGQWKPLFTDVVKKCLLNRLQLFLEMMRHT
jgi:hypothetical protein